MPLSKVVKQAVKDKLSKHFSDYISIGDFYSATLNFNSKLNNIDEKDRNDSNREYVDVVSEMISYHFFVLNNKRNAEQIDVTGDNLLNSLYHEANTSMAEVDSFVNEMQRYAQKIQNMDYLDEIEDTKTYLERLYGPQNDDEISTNKNEEINTDKEELIQINDDVEEDIEDEYIPYDTIQNNAIKMIEEGAFDTSAKITDFAKKISKINADEVKGFSRAKRTELASSALACLYPAYSHNPKLSSASFVKQREFTSLISKLGVEHSIVSKFINSAVSQNIEIGCKKPNKDPSESYKNSLKDLIGGYDKNRDGSFCKFAMNDLDSVNDGYQVKGYKQTRTIAIYSQLKFRHENRKGFLNILTNLGEHIREYFALNSLTKKINETYKVSNEELSNICNSIENTFHNEMEITIDKLVTPVENIETKQAEIKPVETSKENLESRVIFRDNEFEKSDIEINNNFITNDNSRKINIEINDIK